MKDSEEALAECDDVQALTEQMLLEAAFYLTLASEKSKL